MFKLVNFILVIKLEIMLVCNINANNILTNLQNLIILLNLQLTREYYLNKIIFKLYTLKD